MNVIEETATREAVGEAILRYGLVLLSPGSGR